METVLQREAPASFEDAASALRRASEEALAVRPRGAGTKLSWGRPVREPDLELALDRLDRLVEHNAGDLTAVLEAGVRLADAQAAFGSAGQMLALDPPLGTGEAATIGGVVATADSGPLRHRYGGVRDLLLGAAVALPDGSVARSGGKVIKNVAGYDLAKLFAGSFGTLGLILQVVVRLHPVPDGTATLVGRSDEPSALARASLRLARAPLELEALDVAWNEGSGLVLGRFAGKSAGGQAERTALMLREEGLESEILVDDAGTWSHQRSRQRASDGAIVRVSALPAALARVIGAAGRLRGSLVGRAGIGVAYIRLPPGEPADLAAAVEELRRELAPARAVVLDAAAEVRERVDAWGERDEGLLRLSRAVKERFDPRGVCNPGVFVGGI
ncbi:MAG: FAD-binding oxidoreductase [Actinomycetota bacterium]|nr:FAD-binding oxidoreductase [Actinomycetota bacterium]